MSYLLLAAGLLALIYWGGRGRRILKHQEWRVASGAAAVVLFAAAAFVAVRGGELKALVLLLLGLGLALAARWPRPLAGAQPGPSDSTMSLNEARAVLGVGPGASTDEIQAAYGRLMRRVHPDHGGAPGLALQLNLARDRLLKRS
ncbi:MAG TPA: molecular chaperone DnaJ [Caulobacteraceae bacterium]|jgi:DnaJ-domain-containing protein 1|nr:molecular chaperone DnaJ [Caulobacteraceae bacterium]